MVAEVRRVRNDSQQHVHKTVSGPKYKVYITASFDQASTTVGDAQCSLDRRIR